MEGDGLSWPSPFSCLLYFTWHGVGSGRRHGVGNVESGHCMTAWPDAVESVSRKARQPVLHVKAWHGLLLNRRHIFLWVDDKAWHDAQPRKAYVGYRFNLLMMRII